MADVVFNFTMTADDIMKFFDAATEEKFKMTRIMSLICAVIVGVYTGAFLEKFVIAAICVAIFLAAGLLIPAYERMKAKKSYSTAFHVGKAIEIGFFEDHLEERMFPAKEGDFESESYLPYEKIMNITETDDMFFVYISPVQAYIIPKRIITDKDRVNLFKIIEKNFSDKFIRTNINKVMKNQNNKRK